MKRNSWHSVVITTVSKNVSLALNQHKPKRPLEMSECNMAFLSHMKQRQVTNIMWDFTVFAVLFLLTTFLSVFYVFVRKKITYKHLYPFSLRQRGDLLRERWVRQTKSCSSEDGEKVSDTLDSQRTSPHRYSSVEQTKADKLISS